MRFLYDNILLNSRWTTLTPTPFDNSVDVSDGYGSANILDGRRETQWRVNTSYGSTVIRLEIDGTLLSSGNMTFNGVGLSGINARDCELNRILIEDYSGGWNTLASWNNLDTNLSITLNAGSYVDLMFEMTSAHAVTTKLRISLYLSRSPAQTGNMIRVGQVMFGTIVDLVDEPNEGMETPLAISTAREFSEGGGASYISRPSISEPWQILLRSIDATQLADMRDIVLKSYGGARPILFHTYRHVGVLDWTDWSAVGGIGGIGKYLGGGFHANFDAQELPVTDVRDGIYDVAFSMRRSLTRTEAL